MASLTRRTQSPLLAERLVFSKRCSLRIPDIPLSTPSLTCFMTLPVSMTSGVTMKAVRES